ncbi:maltose acetyltransferase domain-containing protein [Corynebacterium minutissimum]
MTHPNAGSFERMASGTWFMPGVNEEVSAEHHRGFQLVKELNALQNTDRDRAHDILRALLSPESEVPGLHTPLNLEYGRNVTVLPGVTVGKNCVVGAGSLVTRDVPDNSLVLGSPGRVVRKLEDNEDRWERQDLHV